MYSNFPKVGLTKPVIILAIVDLPDPDSPTNPSVSPSNNSKDTSFTALTAFSSILLPNEKDWSSKILVIFFSSNNFWLVFFLNPQVLIIFLLD